jgi:hypothetical protein
VLVVRGSRIALIAAAMAACAFVLLRVRLHETPSCPAPVPVEGQAEKRTALPPHVASLLAPPSTPRRASRPRVASSKTPCAISGRVLGTDGKGVVGAEAFLISDGMSTPATTDDSGEFRFDTLGPGDYLLWAKHGSQVSDEAISVSLAPGECLEELELPLAPGRVITGSVVDENDDPAAARVCAFSSVGRIVFACSPVGHTFRLGPVPNDPLKLTASFARMQAHADVQAGETDVTIRLHPLSEPEAPSDEDGGERSTQSFSFHIVDEVGSPVEVDSVSFRCGGPDGVGGGVVQSEPASSFDLDIPESCTDVCLRFDELVAGCVRPERDRAVEVRVARASNVVGVVRAHDGALAQGIEISCEGDSTSSSAAGRFTLTCAPDAAWLDVDTTEARSRRRVPLALAPGATYVQLML